MPVRLLGASFARGTGVTEKALGREGWGGGGELEAQGGWGRGTPLEHRKAPGSGPYGRTPPHPDIPPAPAGPRAGSPT